MRGVRRRSLDQALAQAALAAQPPLDARIAPSSRS